MVSRPEKQPQHVASEKALSGLTSALNPQGCDWAFCFEQDANTALSSLNFIMSRNAKPDVAVLGDAHQGNLRERIGATCRCHIQIRALHSSHTVHANRRTHVDVPHS